MFCSLKNWFIAFAFIFKVWVYKSHRNQSKLPRQPWHSVWGHICRVTSVKMLDSLCAWLTIRYLMHTRKYVNKSRRTITPLAFRVCTCTPWTSWGHPTECDVMSRSRDRMSRLLLQTELAWTIKYGSPFVNKENSGTALNMYSQLVLLVFGIKIQRRNHCGLTLLEDFSTTGLLRVTHRHINTNQAM